MSASRSVRRSVRRSPVRGVRRLSASVSAANGSLFSWQTSTFLSGQITIPAIAESLGSPGTRWAENSDGNVFRIAAKAAGFSGSDDVTNHVGASNDVTDPTWIKHNGMVPSAVDEITSTGISDQSLRRSFTVASGDSFVFSFKIKINSGTITGANKVRAQFYGAGSGLIDLSSVVTSEYQEFRVFAVMVSSGTVNAQIRIDDDVISLGVKDLQIENTTSKADPTIPGQFTSVSVVPFHPSSGVDGTAYYDEDRSGTTVDPVTHVVTRGANAAIPYDMGFIQRGAATEEGGDTRLATYGLNNGCARTYDVPGVDGVVGSMATMSDANGSGTSNFDRSVAIPANTNKQIAVYYVPVVGAPTSYPALRLRLYGAVEQVQHIVPDQSDGSFVVITGDGAASVTRPGDFWRFELTIINANNATAQRTGYPAWNLDGSATQNTAATGSLAVHSELYETASAFYPIFNNPSSPYTSQASKGATVTDLIPVDSDTFSLELLLQVPGTAPTSDETLLAVDNVLIKLNSSKEIFIDDGTNQTAAIAIGNDQFRYRAIFGGDEMSQSVDAVSGSAQTYAGSASSDQDGTLYPNGTGTVLYNSIKSYVDDKGLTWLEESV